MSQVGSCDTAESVDDARFIVKQHTFVHSLGMPLYPESVNILVEFVSFIVRE